MPRSIAVDVFKYELDARASRQLSINARTRHPGRIGRTRLEHYRRPAVGLPGSNDALSLHETGQDNLFWLITDSEGPQLGSFTAGYIEELRERAK